MTDRIVIYDPPPLGAPTAELEDAVRVLKSLPPNQGVLDDLAEIEAELELRRERTSGTAGSAA